MSDPRYLIKRYAPFFAPLPVPTSGIFDTPHSCLQINEEWQPWVAGALEVLKWKDRYTGTDEQIRFALHQMELLILAVYEGSMACDEDGDVRLRQSPTDPCVMQISYDSGYSWETAFNYGLCFEKQQESSSQTFMTFALVNQWTNQQVTIYNGTCQSIAPNMVYNGGNNGARDKALCMLIESLVEMTATVALEARDDMSGWEWDLARFFVKLQKYAVVAIDVIINVFFYGWVTLADEMALGLAFALLESIEELLEAPDVANFADGDLLRDIICYAYGGVQGSTMELVDYVGMFQGVSIIPNVTSDMETWLTKATSEMKAYVSALSFLNEAYEGLVDGSITYTCPCTLSEYEYHFDTGMSMQGWVAAEGTNVFPTNESGNNLSGGSGAGCLKGTTDLGIMHGGVIVRDMGSIDLRSVKVAVGKNSGFTPNLFCSVFLSFDGGVTYPIDLQPYFDSGPTQNGLWWEWTYLWGGIWDNVTHIKIRFGAEDPFAAFGYIDDILLTVA